MFSGSGYGSGDGYGSGSGSGYGYGYGDGSGSGSGYGYGYGYGYGDGSGSGYGYGDNAILLKIGEHDVIAINAGQAWQIVKVGCHVWPLAWWRSNWERMATENGIGREEAQAALEKVEQHFTMASAID